MEFVLPLNDGFDDIPSGSEHQLMHPPSELLAHFGRTLTVGSYSYVGNHQKQESSQSETEIGDITSATSQSGLGILCQREVCKVPAEMESKSVTGTVGKIEQDKDAILESIVSVLLTRGSLCREVGIVHSLRILIWSLPVSLARAH